MVGANVSTNALPTNWLTTLNGLSRQIIAIGTESGIDYIDIKLSGTANNTVATIAPESSTQIVAASGQTWTNSVYIKIISQPSPPSSYSLAFREGTSGGSFVNSGSSAITPTTTLQRLSATRTLTGATTERVQPQINFALVSGSTYDFTVRIGWPQMEQSSVATSPIPTTTGSASRNADQIVASGALVSGLIGQTEGTIYAEVDLRNWIASGRILTCSNGTSNERIIIQVGANRTLQAIVTTASADVVDISTASGQVNGVYKCALTYASGDFAFYVNGTQIGTDSSGGVPASTSVFLGKIGTSASTNFLNDRIRAAALYTTRLTDAQLAELTRL
jgi:molybdopterin-binding protein